MVRFLAAMCLMAIGGQAPAEERLLRVASTEFPPYYGSTLENGGFIAQIVTSAFAESEHAIEVEFLPWARALEATKAGEFDALFTVWYRADREAFLVYSDPLPPNEVGFFKRAGAEIAFQELSDLSDTSIGIVRGYAAPPEFEAAGLVTEPANSNVENVRKLLRGRIDLIVSDRLTALDTLSNALGGSPDEIEWIEPAITAEIQYLVVPKALEDHAEIVARFNAGLAAIIADGTLDQIVQERGF